MLKWMENTKQIDTTNIYTAMLLRQCCLPAYNGITPLDRMKMAIALPMTSWMSHPMIAISIMIHMSSLANLGYSVLQHKHHSLILFMYQKRHLPQPSDCPFTYTAGLQMRPSGKRQGQVMVITWKHANASETLDIGQQLWCHECIARDCSALQTTCNAALDAVLWQLQAWLQAAAKPRPA